MGKNKNRYMQKAHKTALVQIIKGDVSGKGKLGSSAALTLKDLVLVVLGGGVVGAITGKFALPVGLLVTGAGHYSDSKIMQLIGIGTMAANTFTKVGKAVGDLEGLDGVKERLEAYRESLKEKFFLDKLLKKKEPVSINGIGEVQFFNYPEGNMNGDLAALDAIEQQLTESALQFQGTGNIPDYPVGDTTDYQAGNVPEYQIGDLEDRLY